MIAIAFKFPAGRYHATPWGRHVNEADAEWPPAPWRILRALIAIWHRKADHQLHPDSQLASLIDKLSEAPPSFYLPKATRAHTRHYMPVRQGKADRAVLIFDAFVRINANDRLVAVWPDSVNLDDTETTLLDDLLRDLGFMGRAESWVEAYRLTAWNGLTNCVPSDLSVNAKTGEAYEPVSLIAPTPNVDYTAWRQQTISNLDWRSMKPRWRKQLCDTLPERLVDALRLETGDIRAVGWSRPPGAHFITYQRPYNCFTPERHGSIRKRRGTSAPVTTARLVLAGKPLPRIEDAVRIGEIARLATITQSARLTGKAGVPWTLSGHNQPAGNRHGHAFYLPEANDNGRIEHILIHVPGGIDHEALRALDRIDRLWQDDGAEWQALLERYGSLELFGDSRYVGPSRTWESSTPYLHPWYRKKKFTIEDQLRRECRERGLPAPNLELIRTISIKGRTRRPVHFYRFRSKRGLSQPDTKGSFWKLTFPEPIYGPLALGFGCHFGLGAFRKQRWP